MQYGSKKSKLRRKSIFWTDGMTDDSPIRIMFVSPVKNKSLNGSTSHGTSVYMPTLNFNLKMKY